MEEGVGSLMMAQADPPMDPSMMEVGNTPPVNFRHGGPVAVRGYQDGTPPGGNSANPVLTQAKRDAPAYQQYFAGAFDSEARAADLQEQREMSQAQMLFDIAGAGLAFAGETQGGSLAERLANAASKTQLTEKIGTRAANMLTAKQAQASEDRQMRMAGLQASLTQSQTDKAARDAIATAAAKPRTEKMHQIVGADGVVIDTIDIANDYPTYRKVLLENPNAQVFKVGEQKASKIEYVHTFTNGKLDSSVPFDTSTNQGQILLTAALKKPGARTDKSAAPLFKALEVAQKLSITGEPLTFYLAKKDFTKNKGKPNATDVKKGELVALTQTQSNILAESSSITMLPKKSSLVEIFKFGQIPKILVISDGSDVAAQLEKYPGYSLKEQNFEQAVFTLYEDGKEVGREQVNLGTPEGKTRAAELNTAGYVANNPLAEQFLKEQFDVRAEDRAAVTAQAYYVRDRSAYLEDFNREITKDIEAELRAQSIEVTAEGRQERIWGRKQVKLEELAVAAFTRSNDSKLGAEARKAARAYATELRDEAARIRTEARAAIDETKRYTRNRADELKDIDAQVQIDINTEERKLGRTLDTEERQQVTWNTQQTSLELRAVAAFTRANGADLKEEERKAARDFAKELRVEAGNIRAEIRNAVDEQKRWKRDRTAELADMDADVLRNIDAEERLLGTTLDKEDRQKITWDTQQASLEARAVSAFTRSNSAKMSAEERTAARAFAGELRTEAASIRKEVRLEEAAVRAFTRSNDASLSVEERRAARAYAAELRAEGAKIREEDRQKSITIEKEGRKADRPVLKTINNQLVLYDPTKTAADQIQVLQDFSDDENLLFGSGTTGRIYNVVSNQELLEKYANGNLNKDVDGVSDAEMNLALSVYTLPTETSYNTASKTQTVTPGKPLTEAQLFALRQREKAGLSLPRGVYIPTADDVADAAIEAAADAIYNTPDFLENTSPYKKDLSNAAWGSPAFLKQLANTIAEVVTLPTIFKDAKSAITAVENLNQEFETEFMAAQEIRDSVFQGKKLEKLTPNPATFWGTGPDAASQKALTLYMRLRQEIARLESSIDTPEIFLNETGAGSVSMKRQRIPRLKSLADGYALLANIDLTGRGGTRSAEQIFLLQDLKRKQAARNTPVTPTTP